jgi:uncharacterized membrane protein YraQ (UPF0718 family)
MSRFVEVLLEGLIFLRNYAFFPSDGETFSLLRILSLLLAFSISGAITVFLSQGVILKYFGPDAKKSSAFFVAGLSGAILAVCSCSVLPMFESIRKKGAGLGPAIAFLFSGPAINLLAITLTFTTLGRVIGVSRILSALVLAWIIGILMHLIYGRKEQKDTKGKALKAPSALTDMTVKARIIFFITLILMLLFGVYQPLFTGILALVLLLEIYLFMSKDDVTMWLLATWDLTKKIIPLFIVGIFLAGVVQAVIPASTITSLVGESTVSSNLLASVFGAFMYFATITEIPIVASLIDLGMHRGPAMSLLLAGPTLSLPNMIVLTRVLGPKKGFTYFGLVIIVSASVGLLLGFLIF